ncbi:MAG: hypothetical protein S4CHLAM7_07970 [Chlamydiae bacterium]|nr:hypothetical protein [Chlamydiota bacterium]
MKYANALSKSSSFLGIEGYGNEISKPKNKVTNVFMKSHSHKLNTAEHLCMKKRKAKDRIKDEPNDVPAGAAIGLVEIFAGALLCILPIPGARFVGGGAILDDLHRLGNAGEDLDKTNGNNPGWPEGVPRPIDRSEPSE